MCSLGALQCGAVLVGVKAEAVRPAFGPPSPGNSEELEWGCELGALESASYPYALPSSLLRRGRR